MTAFGSELIFSNDSFGSKAVSRDYLSDLSLAFEDPRLF